MEALCFDIKAPFASFRVPSTTRGFLTFPFPPRTTILGLIGGILGIDRNKIYLEDHPLNDLEVSLIMMRMPQTNNLRTNQIQTKSVITYGGKFKLYLPKRFIRGTEAPLRSPQTLVFLRDVHYRVLVSITDKNKKMMEELELRLKQHKYVYTPYLGRANYLASLDFIDRVELNLIENINEEHRMASLCATNDVITIKSGEFTIITNVPMAYNAIEDRKKGILLEPAVLANIIYFSQSINIIPKQELYEIIKTDISSLKNQKILFLPFK